MEPESFFHVAIKTDDLDASEAFYRNHFIGDVIERGDATDGEAATAVNHVTSISPTSLFTASAA